MKEHSIWFWIYWGFWGVSFLNGLTLPSSDFYEYLGHLAGSLIAGYIGYKILKWIYDKIPKLPIPKIKI
jgi:hypothetical protein